MIASPAAVAWSCTRKIGYDRRGQARRIKRLMERQQRELFRVYRCSFCGHFHLAHRRIEV